MKYKMVIIVFIITFMLSMDIFAQEVSVVLRNSKVVVGRIVEENPDYYMIENELGQVKIERLSIESITYNPFMNLNSGEDSNDLNSNDNIESKAYKFALKDPVVVYFRNGNIVSGLLLAKSLNVIMLQTESGRLAIPKKDISKIEYISNEYAERGEIVVALLNNGQRFEGNIYFEDSKDLTLDTELGRLTLPKNKLRTIEYTGRTGISEMTMADQYANITINKRNILPRYDVIDVGYTTNFNSTYGPGFGLGYQSRFSVAQFEGLNLSAIGGLTLNYFALNKESILEQNQSLSANFTGGAFTTTLSAGGQLNIYPQTASFYDFYFAPMLETHFIYQRLDQKYPSFPQFNISETTSEFKFGLGLRFGTEFLFDSFRLGIHYNMHYIFGSDGFNQVSLTFVKPLF